MLSAQPNSSATSNNTSDPTNSNIPEGVDIPYDYWDGNIPDPYGIYGIIFSELEMQPKP